MTMRCRYCRYNNEPLPGDSPPEYCGGCGRDLETALRGAPALNYEEFI